jgi:hypothetical protein
MKRQGGKNLSASPRPGIFSLDLDLYSIFASD